MNKRSHIHKKADSSASNPVLSQLQSRPLIAQAQPQSEKHLTQTQIENQEFQQQKFEATRLKLQAKYDTITPEGQERLTVLQAKMSDSLQRRLKHALSFGSNFANIPISRPDAPSQLPVQTKLTIGQTGDKYEKEAHQFAEELDKETHAPVFQQAEQKLHREEMSVEEKEIQRKPMLQRQLQAGKGGNEMIVRRALSNNKLNVVGEKHKESEDRGRDNERQFCYEKTGSKKYWTEQEFRDRKYNLLKDSFHDKRETADPWELRMQQNCAILEKYALMICEQTVENWNKEKTMNIIQKTMKTFVKNMEEEYELLKLGFNGFTWKIKNGKEGEKNLSKEIDELQKEYEVITKSDLLDLDPIKTAIKGMTDKIYMIEKTLGTKGNMKEVMEARSAAMHKAAENRGKEKGVWKVGDRHREDMQAMNPVAYELTSESKFVQEYENWTKKG
ncbi:hypothetical protein [Nostoc sp.]|uniref:hypothetical protein n=1 Tax=Nostoc sp. TaxID=1180 RepID=UPI002FF7F615